MRKHNYLIFILFFVILPLLGQEFTLPLSKEKYDFVNWEANKINLVDKSPAFQKLFHRFQTIAKGYEENIHIFHIGGSHIQADIYSNRLRTYLQCMSATSKGQRGFIFPFKLAKTNNPSNYTVEYDGEWKGYRCSVRRDSIAWGLAGITAEFKDSISNIKIKANHRGYDQQQYDFNKIRVFYDNWTDDYSVCIKDTELVTEIIVDNKAHYVEYKLLRAVDEIEIYVEREGHPKNAAFLMMGIELIKESPGIEYTSIGVNGASFDNYKRCFLFEEQLKLYKPDLFIISIGTNDAYHPDFDTEKYRRNYEEMIQMIQRVNPDCAILLTVPNDSYYKRQYPNPRTKLMEAIIYELAEKYKMGVWDFYKIMGGFNSSKYWYQNKLMPKDRIHFTQMGYRIKADLLLQALTHSWEQSLQLAPNTILNQIINE